MACLSHDRTGCPDTARGLQASVGLSTLTRDLVESTAFERPSEGNPAGLDGVGLQVSYSWDKIEALRLFDVGLSHDHPI